MFNKKKNPVCIFCQRDLKILPAKFPPRYFRGYCSSCNRIFFAEDYTTYLERQARRIARKGMGIPDKSIVPDKKSFNPSRRSS